MSEVIKRRRSTRMIDTLLRQRDRCQKTELRLHLHENRVLRRPEDVDCSWLAVSVRRLRLVQESGDEGHLVEPLIEGLERLRSGC